MMLKNKKTYILAALAVLTALAGFLDGDLTWQAAAQLALTGGLGATIRAAIANHFADLTAVVAPVVAPVTTPPAQV
jgi:uncharacterized membrane protein